MAALVVLQMPGALLQSHDEGFAQRYARPHVSLAKFGVQREPLFPESYAPTRDLRGFRFAVRAHGTPAVSKVERNRLAARRSAPAGVGEPGLRPALAAPVTCCAVRLGWRDHLAGLNTKGASSGGDSASTKAGDSANTNTSGSADDNSTGRSTRTHRGPSDTAQQRVGRPQRQRGEQLPPAPL